MKETNMASSSKTKLFYDVDEITARLDMSLIDIGVLLAEQEIRLCTPVAGLPVEVGTWEDGDGSSPYRIPDDYQELTGLIDLRPRDAWAVLRNGSGVLVWLDVPAPGYMRIGGENPNHPGHEVTRNDVGVRHAEMLRLQAQYGSVAMETAAPQARSRGVQATHDWKALALEVARLVYFDGVPESKTALIRHCQQWFAERGSKVPDESTLHRELKDFWTMFAPEAKRKIA